MFGKTYSKVKEPNKVLVVSAFKKINNNKQQQEQHQQNIQKTSMLEVCS